MNPKLTSSFKFNPGDEFPKIRLPIFNGYMIRNTADIGTPQKVGDWKMVIIYRGEHCPLCTNYLNEIEKYKDDFIKLGVDIIAVSADNMMQVHEHSKKLSVTYPIAHGMKVGHMMRLGLYISMPRVKPDGMNETDHVFSEPALFVVNAEGRVQIVEVSNAPFARPDIRAILSGIKFIRENNYPIRGTYNVRLNYE
ncbi:redoxin domain-containing protein [Aliivibrio sp. S4TY2]|uniref:redoxin domain-containing protein n=1 Tax=unclassified Aliivibrio TaxID=2645654 RepID=UPI0023796B27|nr:MULTISPECIES: redoxin domain-containing protein [unclassified Aliivibrio]MDD9158529.1 redoxin domain-containing protein [Aliivibrio sp. S4TY2]MDD9162529.1 redoxin domain-containing protein [Aliivibrio sp. S4TY1]MDD9166528.1 redoxin domain-containing protein [Aliivibrio sp. S4MY2]MDD9170526.1 redoxin domain-containing protein [Aliivibrio sp. S4MY4]MDD9187605.1 redoxin domain-containing protein [Aliivibrio sp. S4MY3]